MRLIDADALKKAVEEFPNCYNGWLDAYDKSFIIGAIEEQPSIDIVRCKNCKHWNGDGVFTINALGKEEQLCKWWSKFGTIRTASTDYCSYGEGRE